MVQIIAGDRGKGKTKFLLDKANEIINSAEGSVVYLDKNSKHMHELNIKVRLINVADFSINSTDGFIGFIAGIISQDRDLQYMFLDSFLKLSGLEEDDTKLEEILNKLDAFGSKYGVTFVLSISKAADSLPENQKGNIIVSL